MASTFHTLSNSCGPISYISRYCIYRQPNWAVKRTPTRAKASPLSWLLLVPCAPSVLRCRLPWALGHSPKHALEAYSWRVLQHSASCAAEHAGMVCQASAASWQINRLALLQAWR
jgi:hypothetical protein